MKISSFCKKLRVSKASCVYVVNYSWASDKYLMRSSTGKASQAHPLTCRFRRKEPTGRGLDLVVIPVIEKGAVAPLEIAGRTYRS